MNAPRRCLFYLCTVLFSLPLAVNRAAEIRIFTDQEGHLVRGELTGVEGDRVTLKRAEDGQSFTIPLTRLSPADQAYVREHAPKSEATLTPSGRTFQSATLVQAQARYTSAMAVARRTLMEGLETALKTAMATGDLGDANAITKAKADVEAGGEPPHGVFKAVKSREAVTAYDSAVAQAKDQYTGILQSSLKKAMGARDLAEANRIQDEIVSLSASAKEAPHTDKPSPPSGAGTETIDFIVTGKGFEWAPLTNNTAAFTNRNYVWEKIPSSFKGYRYTKIGGGGRPEIIVRAKRDAQLEVMTSLTQQPALDLAGWDRTGNQFDYSDGKHTRMTIFKKKMKAGEEVRIPEGNFAGALVLLPGS